MVDTTNAAPHGHRPPELPAPERIVVGVDGSYDSVRAVATAATLARGFDAEVVGVHAVGLLCVVDGEVRPSDQCRDRIAEQLEGWTASLPDAGVRHRTVLEDGPPGLVLLRVASREHADLVVVGTRGLGSSEGVVLGSTSHHLMQFSPVPVVVVPHHREEP